MIWFADILSNKKLNSKLNIYLVFITQSYFKEPKDLRLNTAQFFILKIPSKRELLQTAYNHSSDIEFRDFMNRYSILLLGTVKRYSFLVTDVTFASDDPLRLIRMFQKEYKN